MRPARPMLIAVLLPLATTAFLAWADPARAGPVLGGALPGSPPAVIFPADNWWNVDVSSAPVDAHTASYIQFINNCANCCPSGAARHLHPDFGGDVSPGSVATYGVPYAVVDGTQTKRSVIFQYSGESDGVDHTTNTSYPFYPLPDEAITQPHWVEGGDPAAVDLRDQQDRHLVVVDRDNGYLYELWNVWYDSVHAQWYAGSGAFFDLNTNDRRPEGWTSADAAGLAMLPGLVRYDEVYYDDPTGAYEIAHAFRVTVRATDGHVYPASHDAGSTAGALPMGARLRLKASKDVSGFPLGIRRIFGAMKKHGLIVADNGSDMYITGTYDTRWNNDVLNPAFSQLTACDFEVVQLGWKPAGRARHLGDFNGDGKSDVLWRNAVTGDVAMWLMNGTSFTGAFITTVPTTWNVAGVGDFNGDGEADILWRDTSGNLAMWLMNGATIASGSSLGNVPTTWAPVLVADFNGDGKADILWRDSAGNLAMWLMNGATITSSSFITNVATVWMPVGVGDFNGDGKADILWRHASTGDVVVWLMNGATIASGAFVTTVPTVWTIAGIGDFNADGNADVLWRDTSGNVALWLMNGATIASGNALGSVATAWMPVQVGDFNGDGKADILWRHTSTGDVAVWLMNGATITSNTFLTNVATSWATQ